MHHPRPGIAAAGCHFLSHTIQWPENETTPRAAAAPHRHHRKGNVWKNPAQAAPGSRGNQAGSRPARCA
ncbi:hypothetical protein L810_7567 [Burkholderia sp. AU4i]|nr:hypothetical protein L810_7567 [Burkholderia sp. AU4i]